MHIRYACVAAMVAVMLGALTPATAASPEERRLVIIEAPGNLLTKLARERMRKAIADVAVGQGLTVVPPETMPTKLLSCEIPACLPSVAAASGAVFVVRVDAKFVKESFKLAVELWNSDAGKLLGRERKDCPICDEQDLWGSAALLVQRLLDEALHASVTPPPPPPVPAPSLPIGVTTSPTPTATPAVKPGSRLLEYSGLALCVVGLAAIGVGAYYLAVDGEPVSKGSDFDRDTRKFGLPVAIGGGVALAAGAGLLAWSFWPGPTKVALGPSGISVAGRF